MKHKFTILLMVGLLALMLAAACSITGGGGSDDDDDVGDDDDDDDVGQEVTIYDIQQGNVESGTRVELKQVIVTSGMTAEDFAGFFIQEPDGGAYSGIYVFITGEATGEITPQVGDVVNLSGEYDEYYELSEIKLTAVGDYEIIDSVPEPAAEVLPTSELTNAATAEQWEGVLVRVEDVEVTNDDLGHNEFEVTGGLPVDDLFFPEGQSPEPPLGAHFDSITGPFTYTWETYKICPRDGDDFDGDWTPPADDDDDDDTDATIYEVRQGDYDEGDVVTVNGVINSPTDFNGETFFMQDESGGEYSGIAVYMWSEVAEVYSGQIGDEVTVTGEIADWYGLAELVVKNVGDLVINGSVGEPDAEDLDLGDIDEPWESVLIRVADVTVSAAGFDYGEFTVTDGDDDLIVDDIFFAKVGGDWYWQNYGIQVGDEFSFMTGVTYYSYENYKLEPRADSDLVD